MCNCILPNLHNVLLPHYRCALTTMACQSARRCSTHPHTLAPYLPPLARIFRRKEHLKRVESTPLDGLLIGIASLLVADYTRTGKGPSTVLWNTVQHGTVHRLVSYLILRCQKGVDRCCTPA